MPAVVCHWLLGKRLLERAENIVGAQRFHEKSFLLGCQGPDVFFYHRMVSAFRQHSLEKYGHSFHDDSPDELLASFKKTALSAGELSGHALSYALGLCCHYAYDTCAHPYICQLEERMKQEDERGEDYHYHAHIESALDVILYRSETGGLISDLRLGRCVQFDRNDRDAAALLWGNALREVYAVTTGEKNLKLLLPHMRRLFRLLDDPTTIWRPMVSRIERLLGMKTAPMSAYMRPFMEDSDYDYANIERLEWCNFLDGSQRSSEDFFELTDRAELKSEQLMQAFTQIGSAEQFAELTGGRSMSNNVVEGAPQKENTVV